MQERRKIHDLSLTGHPYECQQLIEETVQKLKSAGGAVKVKKESVNQQHKIEITLFKDGKVYINVDENHGYSNANTNSKKLLFEFKLPEV